jgi:cytochrome c oxidase assembly factor CtaG
MRIRATIRPMSRAALPDPRRLRPARSSLVRVLPWLVGTAAAAGLPAVASAHGAGVPPEPGPGSFLLDWTFEPLVAIPLFGAGLLWWHAVRRVNAAHPANPVPRERSLFFGLGLLALAIALMSGVDTYDTTLFTVHMVQHILLTLVAAPLIVLAGPITLLLRFVSPDDRRRYVLPFLHSRPVRAITYPVVSWLLFAGVMWVSHFSPLFDAALESEPIHFLEHALFLGSALLFWWPAIGVDPSPWRMPYPARAMYVFLQMPQNTFLSMAILFAGRPLYPHYVTLARTWGPTPLVDQQVAAGLMWVAGDLIFLAALAGILWQWLRDEERQQSRRDARADARLVAIREREARLAEQRATDQLGT